MADGVERLAAVDPTRFACWDREVHDALRALVEQHRADPSATFVRRKGQSLCPELIALVPDHGPRAGGYLAEVRGRNLPRTLELGWSGGATVVTARRGASGALLVTVPAARAGDSALVLARIAGAYRTPQVVVDFRYSDCGVAC